MAKLLFVFLFFFKGLSIFAQQPAAIKYILKMPQPSSHYFEVEIKTNSLDSKFLKQGFIDFKMATWTPGSYLIREFARNVEAVQLVDKSNSQIIKKINKNTWRVPIKANQKEIAFNYKVYANELTVRTAIIDENHAYLNPANIFMYVDELKNKPSVIEIVPFTDWKSITTALKSTGINTFEAKNLDELIDSPIEIGNQKMMSFNLFGIPHKIAVFGKKNYNPDKLTQNIKQICETATKIINEHPCADYTFIIENTYNISGGLEHLNSSTCIANKNSFKGDTISNDFLGLIAHEYFHLWNVKRIRPEKLGPFDYENENYTSLLWLSEGFTKYYEDVIVRRAKLISKEEYLKIYEESINAVENQTGKNVQSLTESSMDAWIKYYRPNENSKNSTISYYEKGAIIGGILDVEIIKASKGTKNLDDVMKALYQEFYKKRQRGFTDEELKATIENVIGRKMDDFYAKYINGTENINYNEIFAPIGLKLIDKNEGQNNPFLGFELKNNRIYSIKRDSPAYLSGLTMNDEIIDINDIKSNNINETLKNSKIGETVSLKIRRDGVEKKYNLVIGRNPEKNLSFVKLKILVNLKLNYLKNG